MKRLFLLLALFCFAAPAFATTYYVRTDGSDSHTAMEAQTNDSAHAWLTIQHGVNNLVCGDTLNIVAGDYTLGFAMFGRGCTTWANPITIQAYNGGHVHVTQPDTGGVVGTEPDFSFNGADCEGGAPPCRVMTNMYYQIIGLDFDGTGLYIGGSGHDPGTTASQFMAAHMRWINNDFHDAPNINFGANASNGTFCDDPGPGCTLSYHAEWDKPQPDMTISGGHVYRSGRCVIAMAPPCVPGAPSEQHGHAMYLSVTDSFLLGVEIYDNVSETQFTNSNSRKQNNNVACFNYFHDNGPSLIMSNGSNAIICNSVFDNNVGTSAALGVSGTMTGGKFYGNTSVNGIVKIAQDGGIVENNIISELIDSTLPGCPACAATTYSNNWMINLQGAPGFAGGMGAAQYELTMGAGAGPGCGLDLSSLNIPNLLLDFNHVTRPTYPPGPSCGAFDTTGSPAATIASITPPSMAQGAGPTAIAFVGTGTNFDGTSTVSTGCGSDITVANPPSVTSATNLAVNFTVSSMATLQSCNVTVTTGGGTEVATLHNGFTVTPATCTPHHLAFIGQPMDANIGASLGTVSVGIYNSGNSLCGGATNLVTIAKGSASWDSLNTQTGSLMLNAVAGVATWTGLYVSPTIGSGTLTATSSGLTSANSNSFTVAVGNFYLSQSGSGSGASCMDALPVSFFNSSGNWGSGTSQIGAGDTVHLCGTISTPLVFHGSGTSGNPITVVWETGAKLSAATLGGDGTWINGDARSYLEFDGGSNGIIEATDNGDLDHHTYDNALAAFSFKGSSNLRVHNLTIQNLYVKDDPTDNVRGQGCCGSGIFADGTSHMRVDHNTINDVENAISVFGNQADVTDIEEDHNNIYHVNWGGAIATARDGGTMSVFRLHDNHLHDWRNWDTPTPANPFHHNTWHMFFGDSTINCTITDGQVYNNLIDGDTGDENTAGIFWETSPGGSQSMTNWTMFNNIWAASTGVWNDGDIAAGGRMSGFKIYNNVFKHPVLSGIAIQMNQDQTDVIVENNIFDKVGEVYYWASATFPFALTDYNDYHLLDGGGRMCCFGYSLAQWKAANMGFDLNSLPEGTDPGLDSSFVPTTMSNVYQKGLNLSSLGISALDLDAAGNTRTAPWTMGAYVPFEPAFIATVSPNTGMRGQGPITVTISTVGTSLDANSYPDMSGNGVHITGWTPIDATHLSFPLYIDSNATLGARDVYVIDQTNNVIYTLNGGFTITDFPAADSRQGGSMRVRVRGR